MKKHLMPHDPTWKTKYQTEACALQHALGTNAIRIHHIDSTSIPNIVAKPIIDILIEVKSLDAIDKQTANMSKIGYEAKGPYGIDGRRYFRKHNVKGARTHHVHIYESNDPHFIRHIAFRDYLLAHPKAAKAYSDLKAQLAGNSKTYQDAKEPFISTTQKKALEWLAGWEANK